MTSKSSNLTRRNWLQLAALGSAVPLAALGKTTLWGKSSKDDDDDLDAESDQYQTKIKTNLIGDHTTLAGMDPVVLEGVGLVRGLAGTGGDPSPSAYRTTLFEDLKKRQYKNPEAILKSPNTALVVVRAFLRPLTKKGDRLDVKVDIPDGANATSLVGGELMDVRLSDRAVVGGQYMEGWTYAVARGPVLTDGLGASTVTEPALLRHGRVLSGATVTKERELAIYLKSDFRGFRNVDRISKAIGRRFHDFDEHGSQQALAKSKTDQKIILSVHPQYKGEKGRYLEVIKHLAYQESPVDMRVRMTRLKRELMSPQTSRPAAFQLEAIGIDSIPILKHGLESPLLECRFYAACALAYLGDSAGLPTLVEAARDERAFRALALTAMSTLDDPESHIALRALMSENVDETRYSAFRALWTLDRKDPFIHGETLGVREGDTEHDYEYKMHPLSTTGTPLVHVTLRTRPEIVIFGEEQEFSSPMYASAGKNIMVTIQPGASTAVLTRFDVGREDRKKEVSLRVADVIRAASELGATYPDVLQLLADASRQKNLPATLAIDKIPENGRVYFRPNAADLKGAPRQIRIGRDNFGPNAFPDIDDPQEAAKRKQEGAKEQKPDSEEGSMASVPADRPSSAGTEIDSDSSTAKKKKRSSKKTDKSKNSWSWFGSGN